MPAAAIALTVLCLALIGEGVREAFDPGSRAKAVRAVSYIVRRLFSGLVIVFALTWITFALFWLLPAEPWRAVVTDPVPNKARDRGGEPQARRRPAGRSSSTGSSSGGSSATEASGATTTRTSP